MNLINGYVYIPVSNFDMAAAWYKDILGFELVFTDPIYYELCSPSGIRIMLIERRDGVNSHMMYDDSPQASYGFTVDNIEDIHKELTLKGLRPKEISTYQGKSFGFADLDGNVIELWEELKTEESNL